MIVTVEVLFFRVSKDVLPLELPGMKNYGVAGVTVWIIKLEQSALCWA